MWGERKLYFFVQRGISAVKLRKMTIGVFLRFDTGVILIGDVNTTDHLF